MIEALPSEMQEEIKLIVERMHSGYKEKLITQERINHCITKLRRNGLLDTASRIALGLIEEEEEKPEEGKEPTIYFMHAFDANRIKIGFTTNIERRIRSLKMSSPHGLRFMYAIPGTKDEEHKLHERFAHLRQHGEWFTDCEELREYINQLQ